MTGTAFFDSNVLIYGDDEYSPAKRAIARDLQRKHYLAGNAVVSLQVLQEYYSVATRKLGVDPAIAQRKVEVLATAKVVRFSERDVIAAIELHRLHQISFWDALIIHAARLSGASVLYSEDLQHGAMIGSVPIVNPFREVAG